MCTSGVANPVDNPARFVSQAIFGWTGIDAVIKKAGGKSISDIVDEKDKPKGIKARTTPVYDGLAIGTQVGGAPRRKPLGSTEPTAGLNI